MKHDAEDYIVAVQKELRKLGVQARAGIHLIQPDQVVNSFDLPDLVIETPKRKLIVEVKDAKTYGKLPLSTALEMRSIKETNPDVALIMISLSEVPPPLSGSLKSIGVRILEKPSVKRAAEVIAGSYSMSA